MQNNDLFTITKNVDNLFTFTIKEDNTTVPLVLVPSDVFTATLRTLSGDTEVLTKTLVTEDADNGRVVLTITKEETQNLESLKGCAADRYYAKPSYSLVVFGNTQNSGPIVAKVAHVYVD